MDALKWLVKISLLIALIFLGLRAAPNNQPADENKDKEASILFFLG